MPESQLTKRVLAQAIKELMQHMPLSKITVGDITKQSGVNRNTFYYHFKDKFELVNWIFYTETLEQMSAFSDREHWTDGLCSLCLYMKKNKEFYINALSVMGQNSFADYMIDFYYSIIRTCMEELEEDVHIDEESAELIARFFTHAFVGIIIEWAKDGMKEDPVKHVERIRELLEQSLFNEMQRVVEKIRNNRS